MTAGMHAERGTLAKKSGLENSHSKEHNNYYDHDFSKSVARSLQVITVLLFFHSGCFFFWSELSLRFDAASQKPGKAVVVVY